MVAKLFTKPFGVAGDRDPIPNNTQVDGKVSFETGFGADYERQLGVDPAAKNIDRKTFNELMYEATTSLQELQAGFGTSPFNLALAQALPGGGYPKGALIPSVDGTGFWLNQVANNTTNPDTGGANWTPLLRYGSFSSLVTLTASTTLAAGVAYVVNTAGLTPLLPLLAGTRSGDSIVVAARVNTTIALTGAGQINLPQGGTATSLLLRAGEQVCFVANGSNAWSCGYVAKNPQYQNYTAFTTTGTAAALVLTPVPAIEAYASNLRFRVKFSQASTSTSTVDVSGIGPKLIKQYNSAGVKVPAVYAVDQLADLEYDGTDFILFNQLPVNARAVTDGVFNVPITANSSLILPQLQSLLFRDTAATNLLYRTNHDTTTWSLVVTLPGGAETFGMQVQRSNGLVTLPNGLTTPFITGNTLVDTQPPGTNNYALANTAFVATAVAGKITGDKCHIAGFYGSTYASPYMLHNDATAVYLRPASLVDTSTFGATSSSKNIDTGEIFQYFEVAVGDIPAGGATFNVNFPFAFPNAVSQITSIVLRSADALTRHVTAAYYSNLSNSGFRLQIDEAAQVVQPSSLTAIITVRGR